MGFEQLAGLKKQLEKEANLEKKQAAAPQTAKPTRPVRPAKPRAGGQAAATKTQVVDPVVHMIGKLQKRFPAAFPKNPAPKVPLKIGILADIQAHAEALKLNEAEIRSALSTWCRGSRYWACLTDGAARVDLTGAAVGVVTARDAAFAGSRAKGGFKARRDGHAAPAPDKGPDGGDAGAHGEPAVSV